MPGSLLDNDLYKLTMLYGAWKQRRHLPVAYRFIDRGRTARFSNRGLRALRRGIDAIGELSFSDDEREWLSGTGYFDEPFLEFLADFHLSARQVNLLADEDGFLQLGIRGNWPDTILWEVPLLALISETFFSLEERDWSNDVTEQANRAREKAHRLLAGGCRFVEFGTRRRRSFSTQHTVLEAFLATSEEQPDAPGAFIGTSNMYLAREFGLRPVGTMAHEWIMAHAALNGVSEANRSSLLAWYDLFAPDMLVGLTDTYTTEQFLREFSGELARKFDGVRHDSGEPKQFADRIVRFFQDEGLDPATKRIIYSDALTTEDALSVERHVGGRIQTSYGIGTHFTNDFPGSPPLNIVIKLVEVGGKPVAKLSDDRGKESGARSAVAAARRAVRSA